MLIPDKDCLATPLALGHILELIRPYACSDPTPNKVSIQYHIDIGVVTDLHHNSRVYNVAVGQVGNVG